MNKSFSRVARLGALAALLTLLSACLGTPDGVMPVQNFEAERYLGRWYEIARLDHSFERGLTNVTADYAWREDGGVRVFNRGFDTKDQQWSDIEGKARFIGPESEAHLKVSFFGPFYASYVVFELERENYDYAFVSGFNRDYLWLLARTPTVSDAVRAEFVKSASALGFDTDELIWVDHAPVSGDDG
ncbi:lipocalin family protein [Congregibacter variabilis]|uniref:Outer membrane lipoprotein Blc n=1 Tax=Congregibacter variabilis TaxID=3081200 RepID=A0ABZ0I8R2_9GAMM|nr:lipocalin family protein [Congregibacter sp. IMCC43200]